MEILNIFKLLMKCKIVIIEREFKAYKSIEDNYPKYCVNDNKIESNNIPATGIYSLLKNKYDFKGKYGIVRKYVESKKKNIIANLTIRFETIYVMVDEK